MKNNQKGFAFVIVLLLLVLFVAGGAAFWYINSNNKKANQLTQEQQAQQKQQSNVDTLVTYTNVEFNYSIKIPKSYVSASSTNNPRFYYDQQTGRTDTPYTLSLTALPKEGGAPAYTDDATAQATLKSAMFALDKSLESKGMRGVVTLLKGVQLKGTSYKNGIYATGNSNDDLGRDTFNKTLIVLRDDGSALQVSAFIRPNQQSNVEAEIEAIFNSINLQVL